MYSKRTVKCKTTLIKNSFLELCYLKRIEAYNNYVQILSRESNVVNIAVLN